MNAQGPRRLNWGCGTEPEPGWINSDIKEDPTVDISCDILEGLPLETGSIEYAVSIHALPELRLPDLVPALMELRRVLAPGGVLRLALPDLDRAIDAYRRGDSAYFHLIPDEDARSLSSKMIVQMLWYGYSKSLFTHEFIAELLQRAGFDAIEHCEFRQTASEFEEIVELDNRPEESLFVEARK
ncbi:MAG TPA: methyltransferase domain-containing protein [Solirubrobacterales bacterium]|nr:methyltransferase domain-containing protein [Solirubrobacterales bacterium]